jgi:uncharacterized protein DUF732
MFRSANAKTRGRRHVLGPAAGVALLLLAGAACGTKGASPTAAAASTSQGVQGTAPRTSPSSEQVANAIAQVKERIPMTFQPNEGHVQAFGDAVCTAFDQGKTASQVRGLVLQAASQLPAITVSQANAAFAVETAVNLFCPGNAAKLAS